MTWCIVLGSFFSELCRTILLSLNISWWTSVFQLHGLSTPGPSPCSGFRYDHIIEYHNDHVAFFLNAKDPINVVANLTHVIKLIVLIKQSLGKKTHSTRLSTDKFMVAQSGVIYIPHFHSHHVSKHVILRISCLQEMQSALTIKCGVATILNPRLIHQHTILAKNILPVFLPNT